MRKIRCSQESYKALETIVSIDRKISSSTFSIDLDNLSKNLTLGSSVSIDGVCLTVTSQENTLVYF